MSSSIKMFLTVVIVVMVSMLDLTRSCSCYTYHPQLQFCRGELAFRFEVIAADHVRGSRYDRVYRPAVFPKIDLWPRDVMRRYTIKGFRLYKGNEELTTNSSIEYIYTSPNAGWTCGASLTTGRTYAVVGGYYHNGHLKIYDCDNIFDLLTLTPRERKILLINWIYRFPSACQDCEVVECLEDSSRCVGELGPDECHTRFGGQRIGRGATCLRRQSRCVWMNGFREISSSQSPSF